MIFYLYIYMVAMAFITSFMCAFYAFRMGTLKTTFSSPWFIISTGFAIAVFYELYKLYFYLDIINILYDLEIQTLLVSQTLQTLKYVLPMVGFGIMYERRKMQEERP